MVCPLGEVPIFLREGLILHRKSPGFFGELIERGRTGLQIFNSAMLIQESERVPDSR